MQNNFTWYLKFHVGGTTIFSQVQRLSKIYSAIYKSSYKHQLTFQKTSANDTQRRQRKRNILWFNSPFSKSVVTKLGKTFLRLIDKHFPPHHKLHKLFNWNNVKISYSCMPNVKPIINKHNKTVLDLPTNNSKRNCNCINSEKCPLQQKCLTNNIMYNATITPYYKSRQLSSQNILWHYWNQIQTTICKPYKILQAWETSKRHWTFKWIMEC